MAWRPPCGRRTEAWRLTERLRQQREAMRRLHVVGEPSQAQARHARGTVGSALPAGQDDEAGILRDEVQAAALLRLRPADPAVAGGELEGGGLPAQHGDPGPAQRRDVAQGLAEQAGERRVVVGGDQAVPLPVLGGSPGGSHLHGAQIQRARAGGRRRNGASLPAREQNVRLLNQNLAPAGAGRAQQADAVLPATKARYLNMRLENGPPGGPAMTTWPKRPVA